MPSQDSTASTESSHEQDSKGDAHGEEQHPVVRYPVAIVEFSRVETPFIIGVWILFASIAKIGEFKIIFFIMTMCMFFDYILK